MKTYQPDLDCYGKIIVEIKAVSELTDDHRAQVHNYLKATGYRLGLLVNFGAPGKLQYERIVRRPLALGPIREIRQIRGELSIHQHIDEV